jgi:F0F1-type ATP synthase assembly protein I
VAKKPLAAIVSEYSSLAFLLPVATFVGYAIGYLLDKKFGTKWMQIVGVIVGTVAGFVKLIQQLMRDTRDGK